MTQTADVLDITDDVPIGQQSHSVHPRTSPEIVRTTRWMQNTLNNEEGKTLYFNKDGSDDTRINTMPDVDGCAVTFAYETRSKWQTKSRYRNQANLGDLDPTTISEDSGMKDVIGEVSMVTVATTDSEPKIILFVDDRGFDLPLATPTTDMLWEFPTAYAHRFVNALKQAVILCGGKKSAF